MKNVCLLALCLLAILGACAPGGATSTQTAIPEAESATPALGPTAAATADLRPASTETAIPKPAVTPTDTPAIPSPSPAPTTSPTAGPLLLEKGPQMFGLTETFQVGLGDLDGDGDLDAVFANMGAHDSTVWLNDGSGQFVDSGQALTEQGHGVGVGDLDGDGDLDILMTCAHYGAGAGWSKKASRVYLNDGQGAFQATGQDLGDTELSGNGVNLIDLDGDGDLDAHVVYYEQGGEPDRVYLNDGQAAFTDSGLLLDEETIAWGDLDRDGDVDAFAKAYGQGYRVLVNDGTGTLTGGWQMEDSRAMEGGLALGDLDGDGDLDALVANGFRTGGNYPTLLLWNDGAGSFSESGQRLNETRGAELAVGDLDGDGDLDVFVSNMDRPNEVWLNDGTGQLADSGLRMQGTAIQSLTTWPSLGDLEGDGDLDAFVGSFRGRAEIWFNRGSPGAASLETTPPVPENAPQDEIAFISERDGNLEIYLMNADGTGQRRLTTSPDMVAYPDWSPDGTRIALHAHYGMAVWSIEVIGPDGSGDAWGKRERLTSGEYRDASPVWSPDGTRLLFSRDGDLWVLDVEEHENGSHREWALTSGPSEDCCADWSADGCWIAFESDRDGNAELYAMRFPSGDETGEPALVRLTGDEGDDWWPAWSPDGASIAFMSDRDGDFEIYVLDVSALVDGKGWDPDAAGLSQLTRNVAADGTPDWSPDGSRIAFDSDRSGNHEIYVMDADGDNVQRLTANRARDLAPVWRPLPATAGSEIPPAGGALGDTWTRPSDGMVAVYVPAGEFRMGASEEQIDVARALCALFPDTYGKCARAIFADEMPQHRVTVGAFWIDRTEVTNGQYALCVAEGACRPSRLAATAAYSATDYPVAGIPWQHAQDYCAWAGGRLPTEAEWEYAARGPAGSVFPWGGEFACAGGNFSDAVTGCQDGYPEPSPVGTFPEGISWCGALDMAGNVWEWVADLYGPYDTGAQENPRGPSSGSQRILRGGSWGYVPAFVRTTTRYAVPPEADYLAVGFRCVIPTGE